MSPDKYAILGTERAIGGYPDVEVGPVLKAFPDIEVGQVLKLHRGDLEGLPLTGDTLGLIIMKPAREGAGFRVASGPVDPDLFADFLADSPSAEGVIALSVLDTSGWAVTCEVTEVRPAGGVE